MWGRLLTCCADAPPPPLQAIMMGPFVMAGLTHDTRVLVADPARISQYISEPPSDGDTVSWEVRPGCS
jgi:hypothetical protein